MVPRVDSRSGTSNRALRWLPATTDRRSGGAGSSGSPCAGLWWAVGIGPRRRPGQSPDQQAVAQRVRSAGAPRLGIGGRGLVRGHRGALRGVVVEGRRTITVAAGEHGGDLVPVTLKFGHQFRARRRIRLHPDRGTVEAEPHPGGFRPHER
jgi:hypothetical protein